MVGSPAPQCTTIYHLHKNVLGKCEQVSFFFFFSWPCIWNLECPSMLCTHAAPTSERHTVVIFLLHEFQELGTSTDMTMMGSVMSCTVLVSVRTLTDGKQQVNPEWQWAPLWICSLQYSLDGYRADRASSCVTSALCFSETPTNPVFQTQPPVCMMQPGLRINPAL